MRRTIGYLPPPARVLLPIALLALSPLTATALEWQLGGAAAASGAHHHHGGRMEPGEREEGSAAGRRTGGVRLFNGEGADVWLWIPGQPVESVAMHQGRPLLPATAPGYYQALVARRVGETETAIAVHYLTLRDEPRPDLRGRLALQPENRVSPVELTTTIKAPLEIVPTPLPREKRRYQARQRALFEVRHWGTPVAGVPVTLTTRHGTVLASESDARGRVAFTLPDDFPEVHRGRRANPPSAMVLSAAYADGGKAYRTSLTMPYHVDPAYWQSRLLGAGTLVLGMVGGGLIGWRVRRQEDAGEKV